MTTSPISKTSKKSPSSELQQAREHLIRCQQDYSAMRRQLVGFGPGTRPAREQWSVSTMLQLRVEDRRRSLYGALSWVWDAQEREAEAHFRSYQDIIDGSLQRAIAGTIAAVYATGVTQ